MVLTIYSKKFHTNPFSGTWFRGRNLTALHYVELIRLDGIFPVSTVKTPYCCKNTLKMGYLRYRDGEY